MSRAEEIKVHAAVNAKMQASELARATPQRVAPLVCSQCGHTDYVAHSHAMALGWVRARVGADVWLFCSAGCHEKHNKNAPAASLPTAVPIIAAPTSPTTFGPVPAIANSFGAYEAYTDRKLVSTCAGPGCKGRIEIDQRKVGDQDEWCPGERRTLDIAGWICTPQGRFCGPGHAADARPRAPAPAGPWPESLHQAPRTPVPVTAAVLAPMVARARSRDAAAMSSAEQSMLLRVGGSREQTEAPSTSKKGGR